MLDIKQKDFKDFCLRRYALANPEGEQVHMSRTSTSTPTLPSSPASSINNIDCETVASDKSEEHTIYTCTDPDDWTCLKNGARGRTIEPVPFTGKQEEFSVDITDEEVRDKL